MSKRDNEAILERSSCGALILETFEKRRRRSNGTRAVATLVLIIGAIIPLFLLGLLGCIVTLAGVRRGELRYRAGRWIRGQDGWHFWLIASLCGVGGLGALSAAIWLGFRVLKIGY